MADHRGHGRRCSPSRSWRCRWCRDSSSPPPTAPSCWSISALPQNASIYASETIGAALRRGAAQGRSRRRALEHLRRPGRDPLLPAAQRAASQRLLRQAVIVAKDVARASGSRTKLEKILGRGFPERGRPRLSARARTAGRLAGAVSRERTRPRGGARDCARSSPRSSPPTRTRRTSTSTGSSPRGGAHPDRPGPGAAAWPQLARRLPACSTRSFPALR